MFLMESRVGRIMQANCFRKDAEVTRPQASSSVMCEGDNGAELWAKVLLRDNPPRPPQALETPGRR